MKHISIYNRLRRIEGQIRGIGEMIEKDRPEQEVLIQLSAAKSSLSGAITALIESTLKVEGESITISKEQTDTILRFVK